MNRLHVCRGRLRLLVLLGLTLGFASPAGAQKPPYDEFPAAEPPYYRVRYEASTEPGELAFAVNYTIWIPPAVKTLRGVVVHQHGCGEGSCRSGLTGAFDLHWQALARKHDCALLAPSYEQPEGAECQLWCDPRNGSSAAFQRGLADLGEKSGHPELATVPWALWGHSGGGHWAGGMALLHPERVAAAWLRSGVPLLKANPNRPTIKAHTLPDAALEVPLMCNPGTKEGVTVKEGRFAGVWPANETFFQEVRSRGGLIGVAVDPLTSHECGNQRYLAIPWLDACLAARLPAPGQAVLRPMPRDDVWLAPPTGFEAVPVERFQGDRLQAGWLPSGSIARAWMQYVKDTKVADATPPPAPTNLRRTGNTLTWEVEADLESGLAGFLIERDGELLARLPEDGKNRFGRPLFQNLQYSDTPTQPLVPLRYVDASAKPGAKHTYRVIAINTMGLQSQPSPVAVAAIDLRPNIVLVISDDQGWGDLSVHGNQNLHTPAIDSLARDGALFDRFYVCPVCSPTRAELLTGRYHPRGGVYSTSTGGERLDLDERTLADILQAAGYATAAFGKWHNGMQYPYHPRGRGFGEYYGFCSGHWGHYFDPVLEHNGNLVRGKGFIIDDLTDHALEFIERNRDRPFFCYVPYNTPHSPMQVPDRFYAKFADAELPQRHRDPGQEDLAHTRAALAMCENIDWNVGRILGKLDQLELSRRTIVIYLSDNGPNGWRWNGGMKGRKGSTDEGGVRVPCLVRWPERIPAGRRIPQIAAAIDWLPTLVQMAGVPMPDGKPLDGVSLQPLLTGDVAATWPDRLIFSHWSGRVSVRNQRYRLDHAGKLFDLREDPEQRRDVAADHPDLAGKLRRAVADWKSELLPGLTDDDRPFPVGYPEFPVTQLPARDGVPHGNVKRSARAPNCSFFENWTSTDDRITWDVDVHTSGRYEVVLYYTCPKPNVGAVIELSLGDRQLRARIDEPHDPPRYGGERDRVDRGSESYVKDFKPLTLGTIDLRAGRGALTLRALEIPGPGVIDVRLMLLTLQP